MGTAKGTILKIFFGFRRKFQKILKSYLTNQYQYTKVGNTKSSIQKIDCGVPLQYIKNLKSVFEFSICLFADSTFLVIMDDELSRLEHRVNSQLQLIDKWLRKNKLTLNLSKTTYMLFDCLI